MVSITACHVVDSGSNVFGTGNPEPKPNFPTGALFLPISCAAGTGGFQSGVSSFERRARIRFPGKSADLRIILRRLEDWRPDFFATIGRAAAFSVQQPRQFAPTVIYINRVL